MKLVELPILFTCSYNSHFWLSFELHLGYSPFQTGRLFALYICMKKLVLLALVLSSSALAKPSPKLPPVRINDPVLWGGEGIAIEVTKQPFHGNVSFDCARGTIDKILLDKKGGFTATGTYTQLTGAPPPHPPVAQPAHYVGYASKGKMSLMIVIDSDPDRPATYTLVKGSSGHIVHCQ